MKEFADYIKRYINCGTEEEVNNLAGYLWLVITGKLPLSTIDEVEVEGFTVRSPLQQANPSGKTEDIVVVTSYIEVTKDDNRMALSIRRFDVKNLDGSIVDVFAVYNDKMIGEALLTLVDGKATKPLGKAIKALLLL